MESLNQEIQRLQIEVAKFKNEKEKNKLHST